MNLNVTLTELSDAELQTLLDNSGKGKPPVYKAPIREILASVGDKQGTFSVPYTELNPEATERKTVIAGIKTAAKKIEGGDRLVFRANPDDSLVTVIVKPAKAADESK